MIFITFALTTAITLVGLWRYQREKLIDIFQQNAIQTGEAVTFGLREAMMTNDRGSINEIMAEISNSVSLAHHISIMGRGCKITISSEKRLTGKSFENKNNPLCIPCHFQGKTDQNQKHSSYIADGPHGPTLRTMLKIPNSKHCRRCHTTQRDTIGILLIDSPLSEINDILEPMAWRIALTGLGSCILIIWIMNYFIGKFITKPINTIMLGIQDIEHGDMESWLEIDDEGEFHDMVTSLNVMKKAINRYLHEASQKKMEIDTLYSMAYQLSESIGLDEIKTITVNFLWRVFDAQSVILILETEQKDKGYEFSWKNKGENFKTTTFDPKSESFLHRQCPPEKLAEWFDKGHNEPFYVEEDHKCIIPLWIQDFQLGLLMIVKNRNDSFTGSTKKLLPAMMHHISIALANARLYNISITDELTDFHTKRYFHSKLNEMERTRNVGGIKYCILMLDLDHFKKINDQYGHPTGDRLLADVARLIRTKLRPQDIPNRYGGEEFVILLPNCDLDCALSIAERLRVTIAQELFRYDGLPPIRQTVSIGVACSSDEYSSRNNIVKTADTALYKAKQAGRNRICHNNF